jgi:hypothetical protein
MIRILLGDSIMRRLLGLSLLFGMSCLAVAEDKPADKSADKPPTPTSIAASIETTLATGEEQIRQFAFDGNDKSHFLSAKAPTGKDNFTVRFDKPVTLKSIAVATGKSSGDNKLAAGTLEVSTDGTSFKELAKFADGAAKSETKTEQVQAIRIQPSGESDKAVAIREITIDADPAVAVFKYPVEFVINVEDAPEMKEWVEKVVAVCIQQYPLINEQLKSDGYKPPHLVRMTLKNDYRGVAAASGSRIVGSVKFFKEHPDDIGAMVHETVHVVQRYRGRGNPSWLVEGVADYYRFFKYEPGKIGRMNVDRAKYDRSYRVTAAFLAYVLEKYDKELVLKLNQAMREGKYKEEMFKELTGKTVQELNEEWRASLGAKPDKPKSDKPKSDKPKDDAPKTDQPKSDN